MYPLTMIIPFSIDIDYFSDIIKDILQTLINDHVLFFFFT